MSSSSSSRVTDENDPPAPPEALEQLDVMAAAAAVAVTAVTTQGDKGLKRRFVRLPLAMLVGSLLHETNSSVAIPSMSNISDNIIYPIWY